MNENGVEVFAPAIVILSRWDYEQEVPLVFPSRRNDDGTHRVHLSEAEVRREVEKYGALNLGTNCPYRIDVVGPDEAQAFMDVLAEDLVRQYVAAPSRRLRVYGFTDAQLRDMGVEQPREEEAL